MYTQTYTYQHITHTHIHTQCFYLQLTHYYPQQYPSQVTYNTEESDFTEMGSLPVIKRIIEDDGETAEEEEEEIPEDDSEDLEPVWN